MELKILGSSSAGNCYVFDNGTDALVVECGVSFHEIKKALKFNISRINGCLVTHEHGDHSAHVGEVLKARIHVYASAGTTAAISGKNQVESYSLSMLHPLQAGRAVTVGSFKVLPFDTQHDAAEPFGFLIHHPEMGNVLFATDTYYLKYTFSGLNNILIECNYRMDILERNIAAGRVPIKLRERTLQSHLSYHTCLETLQANDLTAVNNIVLIHLSDGNSHAVEFQQGIKKATGKNVIVAEKGMNLKFNKTPF